MDEALVAGFGLLELENGAGIIFISQSSRRSALRRGGVGGGAESSRELVMRNDVRVGVWCHVLLQ